MKWKKAGLALGLCFSVLAGSGCVSAQEESTETEITDPGAENQILDVEEEISSGDTSSGEAGSATETAGAEKTETGSDLEDVTGLIEDDGKQVSKDLSDGLSWDEIEEEEDDDQIKIPGLTVDPSKYPAANITENTSIVYWYLVDEMGLNHAAACGVLANIQLESNFRPMALGDSGTSFGICQWHLGRLTGMMSFCEGKGLDYHTLEGQLAYLKYELEGGYKGVYDLLKEAEDTPEGAYNAGYSFCMGFEKPDQTVLRSQRRGNLAADEYFGRTILRPEELEKSENRGALGRMRRIVREKIQKTALQVSSKQSSSSPKTEK